MNKNRCIYLRIIENPYIKRFPQSSATIFNKANKRILEGCPTCKAYQLRSDTLAHLSQAEICMRGESGGGGGGYIEIFSEDYSALRCHAVIVLRRQIKL